MNINGYYQVGTRQYFNKVEAIKESIGSRQPVNWNFNDAEFARIDWTVEPQYDLATYYKKRAIHLRQKYDYLVLHYSGGSDSNQVLQSFLDAGITLDEVVVRTLTSNAPVDLTNKDATNVFGGYPIAFSNALYVKNVFWPKLKISEINVNDAVKRISNNNNWLSNTTGSLGIFDTWKEYDILTGTTSLSDKGLRVGHILGIDKPRLFFDTRGWHTKFLDKITGVHSTARSQTEEDFNLEFFFWDKQCPELVCKQTHVLLNALKAGALTHEDLSGSDRVHQKRRASFIYKYNFPTWDEEKPKSSVIIRDAEQIFYDDPVSSLRLNWEKTLSEVHNDITSASTSFWHDTKYEGLCGFWSASHYIELNKE